MSANQENSQDHHRAELIAEIESRKAALAKPRLLPGIAFIAIWMLVLSLLGAIIAINGSFPGPYANYAVLAICSMIVAGVFGLLMMRRWGWSLVLAAALLASVVYLYNGLQSHVPGEQIREFVLAALHLVIFLYLVRPEVRERMR